MTRRRCDFVVAATDGALQVGLPEVQIGGQGADPAALLCRRLTACTGMQMPVFATQLAQARLRSPAAVNEAVLFGRTFGPREAEAAGFVDMLVPLDRLSLQASAEAVRLSRECKGGFGTSKRHLRQEAVAYVRAAGAPKL